METILIERKGAVATVILNNPEKSNALAVAAWRRLGAGMRELAADETLRCIVLRGAGDRAFSVGADIAEFDSERANSNQAREYSALIAETLQSVSGCRHPTVALIRGACQSEALALAAACDMRVCADSSDFSLRAGHAGFALAASAIAAIRDLVGQAATLELLLEGRSCAGPQAYRRRLVNRVVPDASVEDEACALAERIAAGAPLAARWNKQFIARLAVTQAGSDVDSTEALACFDSEDFRVGINARLRNVEPRFRGR